MKVEDIERLYEEAGFYWSELEAGERDCVEEFARACEQHGIERAKAAAQKSATITLLPRGRTKLDWSALDAKIAKENEG